MSETMLGRPLSVALVSTSALETPPRGYGGTELVVAELAQALVALGHVPTVFATEDSQCAGELHGTIARAVWPPDDLAELRHAAEAWSEIAQRDFDVVHVNHAVALPFTKLVRCPTVATIHHDRVPSLVEHYREFPHVSFVAISNQQRDASPEVPFRAVVHHGISFGRPGFATHEVSTPPYCAFLGRFAPEKGPHLAIEAARRAGVPLRLGGQAHPVARTYFERELVPRFGDGVVWVGEVAGPEKELLLRGASCLLFPVAWDEPFGLVMIEAMLVGTPVIGLARGSVPEVVEEGVTGYVVRSVEEMAERIRDIASFDRERCRRRARERWSALRMARDYVALYRNLLAQRDEERCLTRARRTFAAGPR